MAFGLCNRNQTKIIMDKKIEKKKWDQKKTMYLVGGL